MTAWVDVGHGDAIDASRVTRLAVWPPCPPSLLPLPARPLLEQQTWTVVLSWGNVRSVVGWHWAEAGARAHARSVVGAMLDAAA